MPNYPYFVATGPGQIKLISKESDLEPSSFDDIQGSDVVDLSHRDKDILTMHLRLWTDRGQDYCGQENAWSKRLIKLGYIKKKKGYSRLTKKGLKVAANIAIEEIEYCVSHWWRS